MAISPALRRIGGITLSAVLLTLCLAGCVKISLQSTVLSDDTVSGSITAAVHHEAIEVIGPMEAAEFVDTLMDGVPGVYSDEPYDDGTFVGRTAYFEHISLAEFSQSGDSEAAALEIVHSGDRYVLTGEWRLPDLDTQRAIPQVDEPVRESAEFTIAVTFPGDVVEHNGDLSDKTVTWHLETGRTNVMSAQALEAESPEVAWTVLWVLLAVVVLVVIALLFQLRRHSLGRAGRGNPGNGVTPPGGTGRDPF
ncbi:LppM family (lipo)protein [Stackebrandtia endophytica]|uniref:LppM family (lipo)protein n=1 Tax=Stackebrandtia endophytica TaxID=1496996 RepID=UPI0011539B24|nr:DUF3153 domain-containing protein [Stackebrandtia endophytica]